MRNYHATGGNVAAVLIAVGGALLTSAGASAQTAAPAPAPATNPSLMAPVQKPLSIKPDLFFPISGHVERIGGDTQFSAGLDYALAKPQNRSPIILSIYFDHEGGACNAGHTDVYGLGIAARSYFNFPLTASVLPYAGVGVGVYDEDLKPSDQNSENKVNTAAKVFLGTEFKRDVFLEANYQFTPIVGGINTRGPGVQTGYRF